LRPQSREFRRWDVIGGGGDVISAIAAGKAAAVSIVRYLRGEDLRQGRTPATRTRALPLPLQRGISEPGGVWGERLASEQAKRCLNCDDTLPSVVFKPVDPRGKYCRGMPEGLSNYGRNATRMTVSLCRTCFRTLLKSPEIHQISRGATGWY